MSNKSDFRLEQEHLLEMQLACAGRSRPSDIITVALSLAFIYIFAILFVVLPDSDFSEQENRYLQKFPAIQSAYSGSFPDRILNNKFLDRLTDGKFTAEIADYYPDQFPARDFFVGLKGLCEVAQLKGGNNGIVTGREGYLIRRDDHPDLATMNNNLAAVIKFSESVTASGVPVYFAAAGRPVDVLERYLPEFYPVDRSQALLSALYEQVGSCETLTLINLVAPLKNAIEQSDAQYYYRTDHHWTTQGAYVAYTEIMTALGGSARPLSDFNAELVTDSFYGTTWSSAGMKWIAPDNITYLRYDGDDSEYVTLIADTGVSFDGFYDRSYLDKKDKYSSFLSGNNARVDVTSKSGGAREKLLIIKDSFAHSLAPFLAYHYDLILIDPRYYKKSMTALIEEEAADIVLFLNYTGSLVEADLYGMLNLNLN